MAKPNASMVRVQPVPSGGGWQIFALPRPSTTFLWDSRAASETEQDEWSSTWGTVIALSLAPITQAPLVLVLWISTGQKSVA